MASVTNGSHEKSLLQIFIDKPVLAELGCLTETAMLAVAPSIAVIMPPFYWCN